MTYYAWFPLTAGSVPEVWNSPANWTSASFWVNLRTADPGTLPTPSDTAYVYAFNPPASEIPAAFAIPPFDATVELGRADNVDVGTLGLGFYAQFGGLFLPTVEVSGGTLQVAADVVDNFSITVPGFSLPYAFHSGGYVQLDSGATVDIGGSADAGITFQFTDGAANTLSLAGVSSADPTAVEATLLRLTGTDAIDLPAVPFAGASKSYSGDTLTVSMGTLTEAELIVRGLPYSTDSFVLQDDGTGHVLVVLCMAAGTRIATPGGETAVDDLREGDLVLAGAEGRAAPRPVRWIGRRRLDLATHPRPEQARPVRIRRHAFAEDRPHRDLLLSPDHAVLADGLLIPARLLMNGATIAQDPDLAAVVYYHVELERHDVLRAEGLPVESYLDTGNRAIFENAGLALVLHPDFSVNTAFRRWQTDACAPLATDAARVEPVWRALAARAAALGHDLPAPAAARPTDLRITVDDRDISPVPTRPGWCAVPLPPGVRSIRLRSPAARPSDARPWLDDGRRLGLAVSAIRLSEAGISRQVSLDDPALASGWWALEGAGAARWRWTNGDALLRLPASASLLELRYGPVARVAA